MDITTLGQCSHTVGDAMTTCYYCHRPIKEDAITREYGHVQWQTSDDVRHPVHQSCHDVMRQRKYGIKAEKVEIK